MEVWLSLLLFVSALYSSVKASCSPGLQCCSELTDPTNGYVTYCKAGQVCPVGTSVAFVCLNGATLHGQPTIVCQANAFFGATWSGLPPICGGRNEYLCPKLPDVANAYPLPCQTYECGRGTAVSVTCKPGYQVGLGGLTIICQQSFGGSGWSGTPSCVPQGSAGFGAIGDLFSNLFGKGGKK